MPSWTRTRMAPIAAMPREPSRLERRCVPLPFQEHIEIYKDSLM